MSPKLAQRLLINNSLDKKSFLEKEELDTLERVFETWAQSASSPARAVARARIHLYFLLARYGALRAGEIIGLNCHRALDLQTGQLHVNGRSLFLPAAALRPLRRILTLPESSAEDFLRIDSGFLRRTFYAMAKLAHLPPGACSPRALRYARAIEMCEMRMPARLVARALGMANSMPIEKLLQERRGNAGINIDNRFSALIRGIEAGRWSARIFFETPRHDILYCLCTHDTLLELEPAQGQTAHCHIPPWAIAPASDSSLENNGANRLDCRILGINQDHMETSLSLLAMPDLNLHALLENSQADRLNLEQGAAFIAHVPPHLIEIRSCS